jgi:hypothetical protein
MVKRALGLRNETCDINKARHFYDWVGFRVKCPSYNTVTMQCQSSPSLKYTYCNCTSISIKHPLISRYVGGNTHTHTWGRLIWNKTNKTKRGRLSNHTDLKLHIYSFIYITCFIFWAFRRHTHRHTVCVYQRLINGKTHIHIYIHTCIHAYMHTDTCRCTRRTSPTCKTPASLTKSTKYSGTLDDSWVAA